MLTGLGAWVRPRYVISCSWCIAVGRTWSVGAGCVLICTGGVGWMVCAEPMVVVGLFGVELAILWDVSQFVSSSLGDHPILILSIASCPPTSRISSWVDIAWLRAALIKLLFWACWAQMNMLNWSLNRWVRYSSSLLSIIMSLDRSPWFCSVGFVGPAARPSRLFILANVSCWLIGRV